MEQRKWNLIVFNAPKSTTLETVQRKDDDIQFICNVAEEINAEVDELKLCVWMLRLLISYAY